MPEEASKYGSQVIETDYDERLKGFYRHWKDIRESHCVIANSNAPEPTKEFYRNIAHILANVLSDLKSRVQEVDFEGE